MSGIRNTCVPMYNTRSLASIRITNSFLLDGHQLGVCDVEMNVVRQSGANDTRKGGIVGVT